jgi:hypothetical protein
MSDMRTVLAVFIGLAAATALCFFGLVVAGGSFGSCVWVRHGWDSHGFLWIPVLGTITTGATFLLERLAWPSRTWMMRTSAPLSNRWVANVCRKVCTVTCLLKPAAAQAERQAACNARRRGRETAISSVQWSARCGF